MSTPTSDDQSFADVLNNLSTGPWWSGGRRDRSKKSSTGQEPVTLLQPVAKAPSASVTREGLDEWSARIPVLETPVADASASAARPYTWTRGRTAPARYLAVETLVSTSDHGRDVAALSSVEHRAVAQLCRSPRSVAEVAALLSLPLGVARVLLGDMADIGLVAVHRSANAFGETPEVALMERVLSGLRRL